MEKITLPIKNTGYYPDIVYLLNSIPDEKLYHSEYNSFHPLAIYFYTFDKVIINCEILMDKYFEIKKEFSNTKQFEYSNKYLDDQYIENDLLNFLNAIQNFIDGCGAIIKSFFPLASKENKKINQQFLNHFKEYKSHIGSIVNLIKHNHRGINICKVVCENNLILCYFIQGIISNQMIGPEPTIHKGGITGPRVISINRDVPYHIFNVYNISIILKKLILQSILKKKDLELSKKYHQINDDNIKRVLTKISKLPKFVLSYEMKKYGIETVTTYKDNIVLNKKDTKKIQSTSSKICHITKTYTLFPPYNIIAAKFEI